MTYPDDQIVKMLNESYVPVQVDIEKATTLADRFQGLWTPNLNVINHRDKRVFMAIGWLPPSEMAAMLETGRGHFNMSHKRFDQAETIFKNVFERFPRSAYAPEALYFRGVCRYLATHEVDHLRDDWTVLRRFYPNNQWTIKANVL